MFGKKGEEFLEGTGRVTDRPDGLSGSADRRSRVFGVLHLIPAPVRLTDDNLSAGLKRLGLDPFVAAGPARACSPCPPRLPTTVGPRVGSPLSHSRSPPSSWHRPSSPVPVRMDGSAGSCRAPSRALRFPAPPSCSRPPTAR